MSRILYTKYSNERAERFRIRTDIVEDETGRRFARKSACTGAAQAHIDSIYEKGQKLDGVLAKTHLCANRCTKEGDALLFEYLQGKTFEEHLDAYLKNENYVAIIDEIRDFFDMLKYAADRKPFVPTPAFTEIFGDISFPQALQAASFNNIDYIFGNIFMGENQWTVIDYEWTFDFPIPFLYIVYRAVHYYCYDASRESMRQLGIMRMMGISEELEQAFSLMEHRFQLYILGETTPVVNLYGTIAGPAFSLPEMTKKERAACEEQKIQVYYDFGEGFQESTSQWAAPHREEGAGLWSFSIETKGADKLRVDPGSGCCIIRDVQFMCEGAEYSHPAFVHNGHMLGDGMFVFATADPMFIIEGIRKGDALLHFHCRRDMLNSENAAGLLTLLKDDEELKGRLAGREALVTELQRQNAVLSQQAAEAQAQYQELLHSTSVRVTKPLRTVAGGIKRILKSNRYTYKFCRGLKCLKENGVKYTWTRMKQKAARKLTPKQGAWAVTRQELTRQRKTEFSGNVKFSIIVPLYNTPEKYLKEMIDSVQAQTYKNWELCLADGSDVSHADVEKTVRCYAKKDKRIRYRRLEKNEGISENTNRAIEMATGDYIALFDHDDLLHPSALYENMCVIEEKGADFIYSDENTFSRTPADAYCPHYKPDFSPDTLRSYNYICHFSVFKRSLMDAVGGFRKQFDGSQDYDMILRLTEMAQCIVHIPKIIYYWRAHPASVASDISAKTYCLDAAKAALNEHLARLHLKGEAMDASIPSVYKIQYEIIGEPLISILIPNKDYSETLSVCIDSILKKSSYRNFEIIVIENNSELDETFAYYSELKKHPQIRVVRWEGAFNYSAINNFGFTYAKGDYILLLNNDMEIISPDWLQEMLMFAQRADVGAVGAKLYYPDNTVQHAGIILGIGGVAGHSHKNFPRDAYGYSSRLMLAQNLSAVTAACMMLRRDVYEQVGGLDEGFQVAFNDVDLCMKIRSAGYLIVFTPFAELYHYESKSRGYEDTPEKVARFNGEIQRFYQKWDSRLLAGDPYYNPNLTLKTEDFAVKQPDEGRIRA